MVYKVDFVNAVARIDKHEEAYKDYVNGKKWLTKFLIKWAIAIIASTLVSPHLASIIKLAKELFS